MQRPEFDFDAPRNYNFFKTPARRAPDDFSINLCDHNDYWFMITHVEVSPVKEEHESDDEDHHQNPLGTIRRSEPAWFKPTLVEKEQKEMQNKVPAQLTTQPVEKIPKKATQRRLGAPKVHFRRHTEAHPQTNDLPRPSQQPAKPKAPPPIKNNRISTLPTSKPKATTKPKELIRSKTVNSKSSINLSKSGYIPCPLPIRVQRSWELRNNKRWHSLTSEEKKEAELSMRQMASKRHSNQSKNGEKERRFKH